MSDVTIFLAGVALTLVAGIVTVLVLRRPMLRILTDLCGTVERAAFWTVFSNITLVLVPLVFAMHRQPGPKPVDPLLQISSQIEFALIGLVGALLVLGAVISRFIPRPFAPATPRPRPASLAGAAGASGASSAASGT